MIVYHSKPQIINDGLTLSGGELFYQFFMKDTNEETVAYVSQDQKYFHYLFDDTKKKRQ